MAELILGILAAVGASVFYSLGIALQAMDAKEAPREEHLRLALVWGLVKRGRWMLGTGLSILGWPLQVIAGCTTTSPRSPRACSCWCSWVSGCSASTRARMSTPRWRQS